MLDYSLVAGKPLSYVKRKLAYEDIALNLMHEDGRNRLLSYYKQVGENGVFYGLICREDIANIPMKTTIGSDWLMIATLAFLGKVKTLTNVSVNRQTRENDSLEKLALRLGLSEFQAKYPMLSISMSAARDIFDNKNYSRLNIFQKIYLAMKILILFFQRYQFPKLKHQVVVVVAKTTPKTLYPYFRSIYRLFSRSTNSI